MGRSDIWGSQREEGNRRRRGVNGFFFFLIFLREEENGWLYTCWWVAHNDGVCFLWG